MQKLTISEIVFIAIMSAGMGVLWWAYTFINDILAPMLKLVALDGLLSGVWLMGGTFFAYIIRKQGSALLGEMIAAIVQGFISRWGVSSLIYGFIQALPVELYFFALKYKKWHYSSMIIAGVLAALAGYALTFIWLGYFHLPLWFNLTQLIGNAVSGVIFPGILAKVLADKLCQAHALDNFNIAKDGYCAHFAKDAAAR